MTPLVIVPFHDPAWLANVEANLCRQTVQARVVFAVNGKAADFTSARWQVTPSGTSHAAAVNAGVEWARDDRDFTHAVLMDSDDYYGPGYLAQALEALKTADCCGKRAVYTWLENGLHLFDRVGGRFMGGTLGFNIKKFRPMPAVHQDDTEWCRAMEESGAVGVDTGPTQYAYVRHGANAHWQANDTIVRKAWGSSRFFPGALVHDVNGDPGISFMRPPPSDAEVFEAM